jgi:hypothetical protein
MEKPTQQYSEVAAMYPSYAEEAATLRNVSIAAYETAFSTIDKRGEGFILPSEIRMVLREAFHIAANAADAEAKAAAASVPKGTITLTAAAVTTVHRVLEPPDHLVNLFHGICDRYDVKKISPYGFLEMVADVADLIDAELKVQTPAAMAASIALRTKGNKTMSSSSSLGQTLSEEESAAAVAASAAAAAAAEASAGFDTSVRHLTAGPLKASEEEVRGLYIGTMREAMLTADRAAKGMPAKASSSASASASAGGIHLVGPLPTSTYLRDVGPYGHDPRSIAIHDPLSGGIPQTTRELSVGTTRTAAHPPGFMGHVPHTAMGSGAGAAPGFGATARDTFHAQTNLTSTYVRRVPGYTGFLPNFSVFESHTVNKPKGAAANSDVDRAGGQLESYWLSETRRAQQATTKA